MKNFFTLFGSLFLASIFCMSSIKAQADTEYTADDLKKLNAASNITSVSIHDPSIVYDAQNDKFYIWGTMRGLASSSNMINWAGLNGNDCYIKLNKQGDKSGTLCNQLQAFKVQQVTKVKNYQGNEVAFPNFDAAAYRARYDADPAADNLSGNMWAPDIVYNPTMGKWCLYFSINADHWSSIIVLLTADKAEGPYTYQGPVVMGGFNGQTYGGKSAPKIDETDFTIATGLTSFPGRYKAAANGSYWPNCIDPCVFYDEEGELWMAYGSWSGGIFMLKLDKETGLRDYTYTYPYEVNGSPSTAVGTPDANCTSDPYFGRKIAGGHYVSGEGAYIQHIGKYYYLFMSYGGYAPREGYEMRVFRSEKPDGSYVDAYGRSARYTGYVLNYGSNAGDNRGTRLMGVYNNWGEMQKLGWCGQGHNSAIVDKEGRAFVVYHTKFNDGWVGHLVHINQLFVNEAGWLVASPFPYQGETTTDADIKSSEMWTTDQITGDYQVLIHSYKQKVEDSTYIADRKPLNITLTEDGKISGEQTGTWSVTPGTSYISIKLGSYTYKGVLVEGGMSGDSWGLTWNGNKHKTLCFTAMDSNKDSNSGIAVWGYQLQPASALARNYATISFPDNLDRNLYFPMEDGVKFTWLSSSNKDIFDNGFFNAPESSPSGRLTLEYEMRKKDAYYKASQSYRATKIETGKAAGDYSIGLVAYYDMNEQPIVNRVNESETATLGKAGTGTEPILETHPARTGMVLHQYFGAQANVSYTRMDNPLKGQSNLSGATISMWVKRDDTNVWDAVWSFFDSTIPSLAGERFFVTGNAYIGYNNNAGSWFDINHPNNATTNFLPVNRWVRLTLTIAEDGVNVYIDGEKKKQMAFNSGNLDYAKTIAFLAKARYFCLGMGSFWGSLPAQIDDVLIYNRVLSSEDIAGLSIMQNRNYDFATGQYMTGIEETEADIISDKEHGGNLIYDLSGRRISTPQKGLYIHNGKKIIK